MNMSERPLFFDVSSHQGTIRFAKLSETPQPVLGIYSRAGYGLIKDPTFERNYTKCGEHGLYRTSYWAFYPQHNATTQLDKWYEQHPELDGIPRVIDLEVGGGVEPSAIADMILHWSDVIRKRDGVAPWIYTRANLFDTWIAPYWLETDINMHFYILAQYDAGDGKEYEGLILPDKMHVDRVLFKQTSDGIAPAPLGLAPEAAAIDRNRWLLGDEEQMHDYLRALYFEPEQLPPVGDYATVAYVDKVNNDLLKEIDTNVDELEKLTNQHHADHAKMLSLTAALEGGYTANAAEIERLDTTAENGDLILLKEIETLRQREIEHTREHNADIERIDKDIIDLGAMNFQINGDIAKLKARAVELGVKLDLQNKRIDEAFTDITAQAQTIEDNYTHLRGAMIELDDKFEEIELQNNHTHPKIFKWLRLINRR